MTFLTNSNFLIYTLPLASGIIIFGLILFLILKKRRSFKKACVSKEKTYTLLAAILLQIAEYVKQPNGPRRLNLIEKIQVIKAELIVYGSMDILVLFDTHINNFLQDNELKPRKFLRSTERILRQIRLELNLKSAPEKEIFLTKFLFNKAVAKSSLEYKQIQIEDLED